MDCKVCHEPLPMIQASGEMVHPFCKRKKLQEENPQNDPPKSEFDKALERWKVSDDPEGA